MSDFSDRPFVAGSVVGLRAFAVDQLGRLYGPSIQQVFTPGENVAVCRKEEAQTWTMWGVPMPKLTFTVNPPPVFASDPSSGEVTAKYQVGVAEAAVKAKECEHTVGGLGCSCGFYAYFDGQNDYKTGRNIAAVIEGYGVCTVGTRGFRAAKARLLALVEPKSGVSPMVAGYIRRNYPDVPIFAKKRLALAEFPLTVPEPTATPNDSDFWTRAVK